MSLFKRRKESERVDEGPIDAFWEKYNKEPLSTERLIEDFSHDVYMSKAYLEDIEKVCKEKLKRKPSGELLFLNAQIYEIFQDIKSLERIVNER